MVKNVTIKQLTITALVQIGMSLFTAGIMWQAKAGEIDQIRTKQLALDTAYTVIVQKQDATNEKLDRLNREVGELKALLLGRPPFYAH